MTELIEEATEPADRRADCKIRLRSTGRSVSNIGLEVYKLPMYVQLYS